MGNCCCTKKYDEEIELDVNVVIANNIINKLKTLHSSYSKDGQLINNFDKIDDACNEYDLLLSELEKNYNEAMEKKLNAQEKKLHVAGLDNSAQETKSRAPNTKSHGIRFNSYGNNMLNNLLIHEKKVIDHIIHLKNKKNNKSLFLNVNNNTLRYDVIY